MKARNRVDGFRVKESRTRLGPEFVLVRILVVLGGMAPGLALIQRAPRPSERYVIYSQPVLGV